MPAATAASPTPSARVREKHDRRRKEILDAALLAFREKGYHGTTLDDIAERFGVRKTALYHYFPDKEAILYACHQESLAELDRILAGTRALDTAIDRLAYVIREHVRVMTETLGGSPLAFEVTALSAERQKDVIAGRDRYEKALRRIIAQGVADHEFRPLNPKIAVFAILGSINWIARWYRPEGALHADELGREFAEHLVGGLTCG